MNSQERKLSLYKATMGKQTDIGRFLFRFFVLAVVVALVLPFVWTPASSAQSSAAFIRLVRAMEGDKTGLLSPVGLAFSSRANALQVIDRQSASANLDLVKITPFEDRAGSARIEAAIKDPINVTFDNRAGRLLILHSSDNQLLAVQEDTNGNLDPRALTRYDIRSFGLQNPQGMAFDMAGGVLYILDAAGPRIVRVEVGEDENMEGALVSVIDLGSDSIRSPRGLAFDPSTGNLHVMVPGGQKLVELAQSGDVVAERDLSQFGLKDPQGILFAPSGDQTDDPFEINLFLADSGEGQATSDAQSTGQIMELSLAQAVQAAAASFSSSLVRTTDLSAISPPSPDPSGIAYIPINNRLMISDGEVEETVNQITHFRGANVWELTLSGSVVRTANISKKAPTVVPMTNEPTGVAWNPGNGHYYFTDDGLKEVFDLNPGADGLVGTSDDTWTNFDTSSVGNGDPEGIAFDTGRNRLFVADGVNREVYEYTLTGSLVNHFDVAVYGVEDPESVEFNPDSGTLFVMSSNRSSPMIIETTIAGALLQTIDISAASPRAAAGLAYGPASNGSGAKRFYIVDRGVDNNSDPRIIDGKMYEMTVSSSGTSPTATFTRTNTPAAGPSPTRTPTPIATNTPSSSDLIFADGFESGNFLAWSSSVTDSGDLSVSSAAALIGTRGMQAVIDDNASIYLTDDTPNGEPRYRMRFYFDPNSISMVSGDNHFIFQGYSGSSTLVLRVQFRYSSGNYQVRAAVRNDASTWTNTSWLTISNASHFIELDWRAATGAGANNGGLTLWIDGTQQANLTGIDNDAWRIDNVRLGAVSGIDAGTRGTYYFDAFESRRQTYIGPASGGTAPTATNTPGSGSSPTPTRTPAATNTPSSSDLIFADGFESGNFAVWSSSTTDSGDLSVNTAAALAGTRGMQAVIDDNNSIYVIDDTPAAEPRYRARFYFDLNSISMVSGDNHFILQGNSGTSTLVLRVQFRYSSGNYQVRAALRDDASTWTNTSWFTISDAPHAIELDWRAATGAGANNGGLTLWIDGTQRADLSGIDNDTRRIDNVRLGAVAGVDTGTRGAYYFDAFESRRQTLIGP